VTAVKLTSPRCLAQLLERDGVYGHSAQGSCHPDPPPPPPIPALMGSDAPERAWEKALRHQGSPNPKQDSTSILLLQEPGCLSPTLSCSLVNSFYFKSLAGVTPTAAGGGLGMHGAAAGAQHHGSTHGAAGLRQWVRRKTSCDSKGIAKGEPRQQTESQN